MRTSNLQVTCLLQFSRNFRWVLTSMIMFFNNCAINAAHPCLPVVSELLKISGYNKTNDIAHIVAGYAEEDIVLEAKSKEYYACAFKCGWTTSGNVVIHNRDGSEIRRIKINYPKAITFLPSGD